jgi:ribosomal protein L37AE/L43A
MKINEHELLDLNNAYNKIMTVWNLGTDEQKVLAGQIMDDITKLIKFRNRYNPENFNQKHDSLINGAKNLFMQYAAYRRGEEIEDAPEVITLNTAPENKPVCPKCKGEESPNSVESEGNNNWKCHECNTVFKAERRGGKREGAGRKPAIDKGVARKVSITLPEEQWEIIDSMIDGTNIKSLAHYFRILIMPDYAE